MRRIESGGYLLKLHSRFAGKATFSDTLEDGEVAILRDEETLRVDSLSPKVQAALEKEMGHSAPLLVIIKEKPEPVEVPPLTEETKPEETAPEKPKAGK